MPIASTLRNILCARALIAAFGVAAASAQDYPTRPITLVVPFPPGGSTTIVARIVADKMSEALGQSIVIDNRGGAGGTVGSRAVAKSAADGYTILLGYTGTLAIGPTLYGNAGYDPLTDFVPIGRIGTAPNTLVVHPSLPVHSVAELIAYAKGNPGKINYGSAGIGTVSHVCGEYFATTAGVKIIHIPYKGTGPAIIDLLGGHIPMALTPGPASCDGDQRGALDLAARRADHRRGRAAGLRGGAAPRPGRAARHPARDHREAQRGAQQRARERGGAGAARDRRRRAATLDPRAIRRRHRPRGDPVVEGGEGVGRQGRVTRPSNKAE